MCAGPELPCWPTQQACLRILGLVPRHKIRKGSLKQWDLGPSSGKFSCWLFRLWMITELLDSSQRGRGRTFYSSFVQIDCSFACPHGQHVLLQKCFSTFICRLSASDRGGTAYWGHPAKIARNASNSGCGLKSQLFTARDFFFLFPACTNGRFLKGGLCHLVCQRNLAFCFSSPRPQQS